MTTVTSEAISTVQARRLCHDFVQSPHQSLTFRLVEFVTVRTDRLYQTWVRRGPSAHQVRRGLE